MGKKKKSKKIKSLSALATEEPDFVSPNKKNEDSDKYPYFSFRYICDNGYSMKKCDNRQFKALSNTLRIISRLEWKQIETSPYIQNGYETLPQNAFKVSIPNIVNSDEYILVFRFGGKGNGSGRVAGIRRNNRFYILFIDHNYTLYDHDS